MYRSRPGCEFAGRPRPVFLRIGNGGTVKMRPSSDCAHLEVSLRRLLQIHKRIRCFAASGREGRLVHDSDSRHLFVRAIT